MLSDRSRTKAFGVFTLTSYVWVLVSPSVAYAKEAAESKPVQMVPLSDYQRLDGGSLSTASDRSGARADGTETPNASTGAGFEDSEIDTSDASTDNDNTTPETDDTAGEADDTPEVPTQTPGTATLGLPSGDDKSGVTSQTISIPKGSGSIKGMEESFSAQLSTGIATFSVPFALMKARGGAQPSLGLSYSSAGGTGPAGQGWSVGVPFIARQTDRGLPQYKDGCNNQTKPAGWVCAHPNSWHPEQDRFVFNGGQELVPICTVEGGACSESLDGEVMPAWANGYQYFRPRVEGSFLRFFWAPDHKSWIVQDKSGTVMELGNVGSAGPAPGGLKLAGDRALESNPARPKEIYKWHLSRQYDQHLQGTAPLNLVVYDYVQSGNQSYLSDIFDTSPASSPTSTTASDFAHHTHLIWEDKPDSNESYRSGWLMTSDKRLVGVDVASKTYNGGASAERAQVRRYHLTYSTDYHRSLLVSVQVEGRCGASEDDAITPRESGGKLPPTTPCGRLPAMTFGYSEVEGHQPNGKKDPNRLTGHMPFDGRSKVLPGSPDHSLDEALTDFFDVNSDGLPDVLVTAPGLYSNGHAVFFNGTGSGPGFNSFTNIGVQGVLDANANTITLKNLNLSPQDVDGDGRINLLHMPAYKEYAVYDPRKIGNAWWWIGRKIETASGQNVKIDFGKDTLDTQVADVNFDGLVDVVVSTGTEYQTFFSLGRYPGGDGQFGSGKWTGARSAQLDLNPVTTCVPHSGLPVRFSDADSKLADMNGDGILDIVRIRRGDIQYWPGRGNGFWGTGARDDCQAGTFSSNRYKEMDAAPYYSDIEETTLRVNDVNGDGLDDLVQFRYDAVDIWLNIDGKSWSKKHTLDGTPYHAGFHNRVRIIDVNGSGTQDLVWGDANAYKYIDLQGGEKPYILTKVENGLGKTTTLEYSTSTTEMLSMADGPDCGAPNTPIWSQKWCSEMPTVAHIVKRVTEADNITIRGRPPATYVTEYEYRDPVYEGRQREFRGFGRARARRIGDANSPTDVSESVFLLGECLGADGTPWDGISQTHACAPPKRWQDNPQEALKGLPVETHKMDAHGVHLASTENEYTIRTLYTGLDGRAVRHAFLSQADTLLYDTGAGDAGRTDIARRGFIDEGLVNGELQYNPEAEPTAPATYEAGMAHLRTTSTVDVYGNKLTATNFGCVGGPECPENFGLSQDPVITQLTEPVLLSHDSGWMWRTDHSYVRAGAPTFGETEDVTRRRNETTTSYDTLGRPTEVSAVLRGAETADYGALRRTLSATLPGGAAANGTFLQSTTAYDDFGNATRSRGANGRCAEVTYDGTAEGGYGLFATTESISTSDTNPTSAITTACDSGNLLTTSATYDHGIGVVTLATDLNLRNTKAVYDEFGRITALHKPSAVLPSGAGNYSVAPSVQIAYFLPTDLGGTNHSIIHTKTQDGKDETDTSEQMESYAYVDGFGRTLVTLSEADVNAGDEGAWIAGSLLEWDQKSAVSKKYMPFFWNGADPMAFDYSTQPTTPYGRQRYDAFGRQVQTFDLDGTVTLQSRYHALSTDLWDAADLTPGQHQGSYASERKDGQGRTIQTTERFRAGGTMEERHVRSTYHITGEPTSIQRVRGTESVTRWMQYDSLGRMVLNVEPNTTAGFVIPTDLAYPQAELNYASIEAWRYQYNFAGDLIATSDARSCGQNFYYDGAGRILGEDYAPCEPHHTPYSAPADGRDADGLEVTYYYDDPATVPTAVKPSAWTGSIPGQSFTVGRAIAVLDRGSASFTTYDGRGRTIKTQTRIAKPVGYHDNGGIEQKDATPAASLRYAPRVYEKNFAYDAADRELSSTTGAAELKSTGGTPLVPELLSNDQTSAVTTSYTRRGTVKKASSTYGSLITSIQRTADNLVTELRYGDAADTRTVYLYDERRRVSSVQTYRGPPASGAWDALNPNTSTVTEEEPTRQLVLQDEDYIYDVVGNPIEIRDWRDAADWPEGAKPVTKKIEYDDLYRATRIKYEYADGDDTWKSPFQAEIEATATDPRQADPSPHIQFQKRILEQTFQYDWLGNNAKTGDDAAGFYDRSLGTVTENTATGKPYQLTSATNSGALGADGQDQSGSLEARYDDAGNMTRMGLLRNGTCLGGAGTDACSQQFIYDWDEVGRLIRARRWDNQVGSVDTFDPSLANTPEADLRHTYDASDQRVIKEAVDQGGNESYTLYVFESLELRRTQFDAGFAEDGTSSDYEVSHYTVVPYLLANGVRLARLVYHAQGAVPEEAYDSTGSPGDVSGPATSSGKLHVFFELGDHLGSTSVVLDKATGELVERSTFQGYGGAESDYRPGRWANFREDYRFTGKEEDVEVGLQYFGKRFLNPLLGRWVSADPLNVHTGGADWNVYAYVSGKVLSHVDPLGFEEEGVISVNTAPEGVEKGEYFAYSADGISKEFKTRAELQQAVGPGVAIFKYDPKAEHSLQKAKDLEEAKHMFDFMKEDHGTCSGTGVCGTASKDQEAVEGELDITDGIAQADGAISEQSLGEEGGKKDGSAGGGCGSCEGSDLKQAVVTGVKAGMAAAGVIGELALKWFKKLAKAAGRAKNRVPDKVPGRPDSEQQALIDMAKTDSKRMGRGEGPVSSGDADAYVELGNSSGVPIRAKDADLSGAHGYGPVPPGPDAAHIHVNGEHVPVPPGYQPPSGAKVIK